MKHPLTTKHTTGDNYGGLLLAVALSLASPSAFATGSITANGYHYNHQSTAL
jgi:hypothetical protein